MMQANIGLVTIKEHKLNYEAQQRQTINQDITDKDLSTKKNSDQKDLKNWSLDEDTKLKTLIDNIGVSLYFKIKLLFSGVYGQKLPKS